MTLESCFFSAIKKSNLLIEQHELVTQMEERYRQAWGDMFSTSFSAKTAYKKDNDLSSSKSMRFSIDQPIFQGFKSIALIEQNKDLLQVQKEAREWSLFQLYLDTAQIFYYVISLQKDTEHLANQISILDRSINEIIKWVKIGKSQPSDLITIKASRSQAKAQLLQVKTELSGAQTLFSFMTGLEAEKNMTDRLNVPENIVPLKEFLLSAANRNDVQLAKYRYAASLKGIKVAKSSYWPWLDFSLGFTPPVDAAQKALGWDIQIAISYALFSGYVTSAKVSEAESVSRQASNAYHWLVKAIEKDIEIAYWKLKGDLTQKKAIAEAVQLAEENYREMQKNYQRGFAKMTELLQSLSTYEDTRRSLDKLDYAIKYDWLKLKVLSGQFSLPAGVK